MCLHIYTVTKKLGIFAPSRQELISDLNLYLNCGSFCGVSTRCNNFIILLPSPKLYRWVLLCKHPPMGIINVELVLEKNYSVSWDDLDGNGKKIWSS